MKKLLLVSIVLVVIGLGLILYSDPVVTLASGNGTIHSSLTTFTNPNGGSSSSGSGPIIYSSGPGQNSGKAPAGGFATLEYLTIAGIALCGVGIFLTAVEAVSRASNVVHTRTVT